MELCFKPKISSIKTIPIKNKYLIIRPETGSWVVVDKKGLAIIQSLTGSIAIDQIFNEFRSVYQDSKILKLINTLFEGGILEQSPIKENATCFGIQPTYAVLHMTENCNLSCKYCYANAGNSTEKMSSVTALKIVDDMLDLNKNTGEVVTILFHGGEPLLNFGVIKEVVEHVNDLSIENVLFAIQTNATLLSEENTEFLKKHNFMVGISIDGPEYLHDLTRPLKGGGGSYREVIRGVNLLKEKEIDFGAITVLTSVNYSHIEEIFDLLVSLQIRSFSMNPFFAAGNGKINKNLSLNGDQLFLAYKTLIQKIIEHNSNSSVDEHLGERTLKYLLRNIMLKNNSYMCMRTPCGAGIDTLAFATDGSLYICDDFIYVDNLKLGNTQKESLNLILKNSDVIRHLKSLSIDNSPLCSDCALRKICGGICQAHTYFNRKNMYSECRFRQLIIPYLIEALSEGNILPQFLDKDWRLAIK